MAKSDGSMWIWVAVAGVAALIYIKSQPDAGNTGGLPVGIPVGLPVGTTGGSGQSGSSSATVGGTIHPEVKLSNY